LGVVPDDETIIVSTNRGEPCVADEKSMAGQAFRDIVKRLLGENVPLMDLEIDKGILTKIKKFFVGS